MYKKSLVDGSPTTQRYAQWEEHFFNLLKDAIDELREDPQWVEWVGTSKITKKEIKITFEEALNRKRLCVADYNPYKEKIKKTFEEFKDRQEFTNLPFWIHPTIRYGNKYIYIRLFVLSDV